MRWRWWNGDVCGRVVVLWWTGASGVEQKKRVVPPLTLLHCNGVV